VYFVDGSPFHKPGVYLDMESTQWNYSQLKQTWAFSEFEVLYDNDFRWQWVALQSEISTPVGDGWQVLGLVMHKIV